MSPRSTLGALLFNLPALFLVFSEGGGRGGGLCICAVWQAQRPSISRVRAVRDKQSLAVSWPVNSSCSVGATYEIQIGHAESHGIIHSENVSVGSSDSHEHTWTWSSDLPLECVDHSVRLRRLHDGLAAGPWSSWMTNPGAGEHDSRQIFPFERVLPQGAGAEFCCVPSKGADVTRMAYSGWEFPLRSVAGRVKAIAVHKLTPPTNNSDAVVLQCWDSSGSTDFVWNYVSALPQKPANLSCVTSDLKSVLCTWDPGPGRPTEDHNKQSHRLRLAASQRAPVSCGPSSCRFPTVPGLEEYDVSVAVRDLLGEETASYRFNISERVSPALEWSIVIPGVTNASVWWNVRGNLTRLGLVCEVARGSDGVLVRCDDVRGLCNATLERLLPNTRYSTRVRCSVTGRLWGEWTSEIVFLTYPLVTMDVWRRIERQSDPPTRRVTLLWTPNVVGTAMKVNLKGYEVRWSQGGGNATETMTIDAKETQALVCGGPGRCDVTVAALVQKGSSVPAHITVPPAEDGDDPPVVTRLTGDNTAGFRLSWKQLDAAVCGYTVEWCMLGDAGPCTLRWKKVLEVNGTAFLPPGLFQAARRYTFNIYACTEDGHRLLERQCGYLKELKFAQCPVVIEDARTTSSSVTLEWRADDAAAAAAHPAFITGYLVTGQEVTSDGRYVFNGSLVDPGQRRVSVEGLQPGARYVFTVCPLTKAGPGPAINVTVRTKPDYTAHLAKILTPVLLLLGCVLLLWPQRNKLQSRLKGMFAYPAGMHVRVPDLDSFLHETAERLRSHAAAEEEEEDKCISCDIEIVNVKPPPGDAPPRDPELPLTVTTITPTPIPAPLTLACVTFSGGYCPQSATSVTNKTYFHSASTDEEEEREEEEEEEEEEAPEPRDIPPIELRGPEPTDCPWESLSVIYGYMSNETLAQLPGPRR